MGINRTSEEDFRMRYYEARLCIESRTIEYITTGSGRSLDPVRKVSTDITCGDRNTAHKAVDAFFDEYDKMIHIERNERGIK